MSTVSAPALDALQHVDAVLDASGLADVYPGSRCIPALRPTWRGSSNFFTRLVVSLKLMPARLSRCGRRVGWRANDAARTGSRRVPRELRWSLVEARFDRELALEHAGVTMLDSGRWQCQSSAVPGDQSAVRQQRGEVAPHRKSASGSRAWSEYRVPGRQRGRRSCGGTGPRLPPPGTQNSPRWLVARGGAHGG